jgi:prepilin-type processing-associated H-X9-DG protein
MSLLSQFGKAILFYSKDHDGRYPQSLSDLVPDYWSRSNRMFCAYGRRDGRVGRYVYFPPNPNPPVDFASTPIAADYPDNHNSGGNVLYADGSVLWLNEEFSAFVRKRLPEGTSLLDNDLKWYQWKCEDL